MNKNIKKNVYVCIIELLCCAAEVGTHFKLTILQLKKLNKKK